MDSRKSRGMSKIFPCFRPDAVDHDDGDGRAFVRTNGKPPLGKRKTVKNSSDENSLSSSSSFSDDADSSVDGGGSGRSSKGSSRRRFSRAIKAVFFDTSLSRKIRERKSRNNSFRSSSSVSVKSDQIVNPNNDDKSSSFDESSEADEMNRINSSRSSIFSSSANGSSSLSSSCASSRNADSTRAESMDRRGSFRTLEKNASFRATNPVELKELSRGLKSMELQKLNSADNKKKIGQYYSSTIGLCLLLVSLLVLIFWGKICAILCTSVWLFFGPRRIKGGLELPVKLASSMNVDSEEYKKRVIMAGLLERNRNRVAAQ